MSEKLSSVIWDWYATDEFKKVVELWRLCEALEFLAAGADEQMNAIPDCPACEAWTGMVSPVRGYLESSPPEMGTDARQALEGLSALCEGLSNEAFHCDDRRIFNHPEWDPVRMAASQALHLIGWQEFKEHSDPLMFESMNALDPNRL